MPEVLLLEAPKEEIVGTKALTVVGQAESIIIKDKESYINAGELWKTIKEMINEVEETFDPIIDAAHKSHKKAIEQKNKYYSPLLLVYKKIKRLMSVWDEEQERIRLAEQKRLEEEARKIEEEQRLLEAVEAEQNGDTEMAEALLQEPVSAPPVVLPKTTPKMSGGPIFRSIWKFRIVNESAIPRQYLIPDEKAIGAVVRSSQGRIRIAGVEPYEERV